MTTVTATLTEKPAKQPKPAPTLNNDFCQVHASQNTEELATVNRVRTLMEARVAPNITKRWVDDTFPF